MLLAVVVVLASTLSTTTCTTITITKTPTQEIGINLAILLSTMMAPVLLVNLNWFSFVFNYFFTTVALLTIFTSWSSNIPLYIHPSSTIQSQTLPMSPPLTLIPSSFLHSIAIIISLCPANTILHMLPPVTLNTLNLHQAQ